MACSRMLNHNNVNFDVKYILICSDIFASSPVAVCVYRCELDQINGKDQGSEGPHQVVESIWESGLHPCVNSSHK